PSDQAPHDVRRDRCCVRRRPLSRGMARALLVAPKGGLVEWSLATFHASGFVLAIVFFLYSRDELGLALGGLNTLLGLALFVALWATTYLTTCRAVAGLDLLREDDRVLFARSRSE